MKKRHQTFCVIPYFSLENGLYYVVFIVIWIFGICSLGLSTGMA